MHVVNRILAWVILLVGGLFFIPACSEQSDLTGPPGTDFVVFIDFSESLRSKDRALFGQDIAKWIIPTLKAGDRLRIAPINENTLTGFHPLVEVTFPSQPVFNRWKDNAIKHENQAKEIDEQVIQLREQVQEQVREILAKHPSSKKTDIFSSLLLTKRLLHNEPRKKVLVLMSDMIVDYPPYRFDRINWSDKTNKKLLSELEEKGLIPNLTGVCVYVAGISAKSAQQAQDIGNFWQEYFELAEADLDPSRYAHVLLHWPPTQSCFSDSDVSV